MLPSVRVILLLSGSGSVHVPTNATWASLATDTTPDFSMNLPGARAGDVLRAEYSSDGAGVYSLYFSHTLTAGEVLAQAVTVPGIVPLADLTNWDFRFRMERGADVSAWTAIVDVSINAAPSVSSFTPADDSSGIAVAADLVIVFDRSVAFGTVGTFDLYDSDDDLIESFDCVTDIGSGAGQMQISSATLTINPTASLEAGKGHYVKTTGSPIKNLAGIAWAGISTSTTWNWTTLGTGGQFAVGSFIFNDSGGHRQYAVLGMYVNEA